MPSCSLAFITRRIYRTAIAAVLSVLIVSIKPVFANPEGIPFQISATDSRVKSFLATPDSKHVVMNDGMLRVVSIEGGAVEPLTPFGVLVQSDYQITSDSQNVVYRAGSNISSQQELFSVSLSGGQPRKLNANLSAGASVIKYQISNDGKYVAYEVRVPAQAPEVYISDIEGNDIRFIASIPNGFVGFFNFKFSPDSNSLAYISLDAGLFIIPVSGGVARRVHPELNTLFNDNSTTPKQVTQFEYSADGLSIIFSAVARLGASFANSPRIYKVMLDDSSSAVQLGPIFTTPLSRFSLLPSSEEILLSLGPKSRIGSLSFGFDLSLISQSDPNLFELIAGSGGQPLRQGASDYKVSRSGSYLAYKNDDIPDRPGSNSSILYLYDFQTKNRIRAFPGFDEPDINGTLLFKFTPDDQFLLGYYLTGDNKGDINSLSTLSESTKKLNAENTEIVFPPTVSPDSERLVYPRIIGDNEQINFVSTPPSGMRRPIPLDQKDALGSVGFNDYRFTDNSEYFIYLDDSSGKLFVVKGWSQTPMTAIPAAIYGLLFDDS